MSECLCIDDKKEKKVRKKTNSEAKQDQHRLTRIQTQTHSYTDYISSLRSEILMPEYIFQWLVFQSRVNILRYIYSLGVCVCKCLSPEGILSHTYLEQMDDTLCVCTTIFFSFSQSDSLRCNLLEEK